MKRIIKTYDTCSDELLGQLAEKFPDGIKPRHLSQLTTIKGDKIKVVELMTDDTLYLIKFSDKLEEAIDNFEFDIDIDDENDVEFGDDEGLDPNILEAEGIPDVEVDLDEEDEDED